MTLKTPTHDDTPKAKTMAEALRSGVAPLVIRRKGARGELSATLAEKIEVLVILTEDPDQEIRNQAIQTLKSWNSVDVCRTLADAETPPFVLEFAAYCLVDGRP
ncbi:MAG: hypothetical protein ACRD18_07770, partial [Terriglobia bacterium]